MSEEANDYVVSNDIHSGSIAFLDLTDYYRFHFHNGKEDVGTFSWADGICKFEGSADEAAKLFVDYVCNYVNGYIDAEVKRRLKASQQPSDSPPIA